MPATVEARDLIRNANFSQIDGVYANNLPKELVSNTTETLILITDVDTIPSLMGNNKFHALNKQVEVQIFYKLDLDFDSDKFEIQLMRLFEADHWSITDIKQHEIDPDTQQMSVAYYFTKNELVN